MVTIDMEKCIRCLRCTAACPFGVLEEQEGNPEIIDKERCMGCLHCAAACPAGAVSLGGLAGILPDARPKMPENGKELMEGYLMTRRSYRAFLPKPVPRDVLEKALRVSAWAPSAKNQHPTKWIIVDDRETMEKMMGHIIDFVKETGISAEILKFLEKGHNAVMGTAAALIIAYAENSAINPPVDSALALYNAELMLQAQGIGTCWAGYLTRMCNGVPALQEMLKLPEDNKVYAAMMVGYPDKSKEYYINIPNRHKQPEIRWM